jgi:hypothetical protein
MTWTTLETHPETIGWIITVDSFKLGRCSGIDPEAREVTVDLSMPLRDRKHPGFRVGDDGEIISQRLRIPALDVREDGDARDTKEFIYWTGDGWIAENSQAVEGPAVEVLDQ